MNGLEKHNLDNMMQHIGRGNVEIDADQNVGQMTAYVLARKPDLLHDWQHTIGEAS